MCLGVVGRRGGRQAAAGRALEVYSTQGLGNDRGGGGRVGARLGPGYVWGLVVVTHTTRDGKPLSHHQRRRAVDVAVVSKTQLKMRCCQLGRVGKGRSFQGLRQGCGRWRCGQHGVDGRPSIRANRGHDNMAGRGTLVVS